MGDWEYEGGIEDYGWNDGRIEWEEEEELGKWNMGKDEDGKGRNKNEKEKGEKGEG